MKHTAFSFAVLTIALLLISAISCTAATVYVKWDSPGPTFDGAAWTTAYHTVQAGIDASSSGGEVWVARGTYVERITLKSGVGLYGGFVGTEANRAQRPAFPRTVPDANETILDGNQGGHVVTSPSGATATTQIDGFTVRNGKSPNGGGIYCSSSSPTITNNTITGNTATSYGGGIYCNTSDPAITNNAINGNTGGYGGGIYCVSSSPTISNNTTTGNTASRGGGIYCAFSSPTIANNAITGNTGTSSGGGVFCSYSSPTITNNTVAGNSSTSSGGGIFCDYSSPTITNNTVTANSAPTKGGGGIYCASSSSPTITNNTITGNTGTSGSGIYCASSSSPTITNNTITGNSGTSYGGGIYCASSSSPAVSNNIVAFNSSGIHSSDGTPMLRSNCVYNPGRYNYSGIAAGSGDIEVDPKLCAVGYGQVHIGPDSPCVDAGEDSAVQPGWLDMDGQARIQGLRVDMGADESDGTVCTYSPTVVRVSPSGNDANDGSTWALAKKTVQAGIDAAPANGGDVWVAAGTYGERITLKLYAYVYGGFVGTESARNDRNWSANVTVLDGGAGGSVVTSTVGGYATTRIDGFTIRNGVSTTYGGGIYCASSSPSISNNTVTGNRATFFGGGIYCDQSSPTITNNTIAANTADQWGGGIYCSFSSPAITNNTISGNTGTFGGGVQCDNSSPTIANNTIAGNTGSAGGGIYCFSSSLSATITNNTITGNTGTFGSGGIYSSTFSATITNNTITGNTGIYGGGMYSSSTSATIANNTISRNTVAGNSSTPYGGGIYCVSTSATITNNTITDNTVAGNGMASYGGGIYCSSASATIANNTITGNSATSHGGGIYSSSSPAISNNIVAFNSSGSYNSGGTPTLRNNCVYNPGGYNYSGIAAGTGDIEVDPKLCAVGYGQVHIRPDSPCVDAGYDAAVQPGWVDMDGQSRIQGSHVDIGADESDGTACTYSPTVVRVSPSGNDANDGSTWALAKKTVQAGINAASAGGGEVWVAAGTYGERITLQLHTYVYGGFAGTETARNDRNWSANVTVLDGGPGGSVVTTAVRGYRTTGIDGFTIRNGSSTNGGGIYCSYSSPTITNNTITGNTVTTSGGGIYCFGSAPTITNNTITGNTAFQYGGGVYCGYSLPMITNNTISGNSATNYSGGGVYCGSSSATIANNTVSGNSAYFYGGGGICCSSSSATITNNTISGNTVSSSYGGGGICCSSSSAQISNNSISGNTSNYGGGISCSTNLGYPGSTATITNNTITGNAGSAYGGGISCTDTSATIANNTITNNTIAGNSAAYFAGGGIYHDSGSATIANNTISKNTVTANNSATSGGGGIYCASSSAAITNNTITDNGVSASSGYASGGGIYCFSSSSPSMSNNIVAFNSSGIYRAGGTPVLRNNCVHNNVSYNYSGVAPGTGDISTDPLLVNRLGGDYHLTAGSPCIDVGWNSASGLPATDMDGQPRISNGTVDIGADEYLAPDLVTIPEAKTSPNDRFLRIDGAIVSASWPNVFYIESDGRAHGIRVEKTAHGRAEGTRANVVGKVKTNADGERYIEATTADPAGSGSVDWIGFVHRSLGGGSPAPGVVGQQGVVGGAGLNNIGLLVRTWGAVTQVGAGYLYIDDGSGLKDGTSTGAEENVGVRVICDPAGYSSGEKVEVTGISSCFWTPSGIARRILTRKPEDLCKLTGP